MKFLSWPAPPVSTETAPPAIPEKFRCFGLDYVVEEGNPKLDIPKAPLDKEKIRAYVESSFSLFLKTLRTLDGSILDEIRDIHTLINEEINKAVAYEEGRAMEEAQRETVAMKNKIIERIRGIIG